MSEAINTTMAHHCEFCSREYSTASNLKRHKALFHLDEDEVVEDEIEESEDGTEGDQEEDGDSGSDGSIDSDQLDSDDEVDVIAEALVESVQSINGMQSAEAMLEGDNYEAVLQAFKAKVHT